MSDKFRTRERYGEANPHRLLAGLLEQCGKRRRADRRQFEREDFEQRVTIVDRPVSLVEEASAIQEVTQARPFETVLSPFDLGCRAAPSLALEDRPVALGEFPIEARIVAMTITATASFS
jgi:hypothetical protein